MGRGMIRGAVVVPVFGGLLVQGVAGQVKTGGDCNKTADCAAANAVCESKICKVRIRGQRCSGEDQCIKAPTCDVDHHCQWRDLDECDTNDDCARDSYADAQCHTDGIEQLCMVPVVRGELCDPRRYEYCVESTCLHLTTIRTKEEIIWKPGDEAKLADRDQLKQVGHWIDEKMKCMVKVPLGDSCDKSFGTTMCFDGDVKGGECVSTDDGDKCKVRKERGQTCTGAHDLCSMGSICTDGICKANKDVGETCSGAYDCASSMCTNGYCQPGWASVDLGEECGEEKVCSRGQCLGGECQVAKTFGEYCIGPHDVCTEGECTRNKICQVAQLWGASCSGLHDACISGTCFEDNCQCIEGKCQILCSSSSQCPSGRSMCMNGLTELKQAEGSTTGFCEPDEDEASWWYWGSLTSDDERDDSNPWPIIAGCIVGFCVLASAIAFWSCSRCDTSERTKARDRIRNQFAGTCASQAGASPSPNFAHQSQGFVPGLQQQSPQMLQGQILGQQMFQPQIHPQQMFLPPPNQQMSAQVATQPQMPHQHDFGLTTIKMPTMVPLGYGAGGFRPSDTE